MQFHINITVIVFYIIGIRIFFSSASRISLIPFIQYPNVIMEEFTPTWIHSKLKSRKNELLR